MDRICVALALLWSFLAPLQVFAHSSHCPRPPANAGAYIVTADKDYNAVIAAVPLMALLAIAAFLSTYLFAHRAHWSSAPAKAWAAGAGAEGGGPPVRQLQSEDPVHELR